MKLFPAIASANLRRVIRLACSLLVAGSGLAVTAQTTNPPSSAPIPTLSDPDQVWRQVSRALQPPMPPAEWQTRQPTEQEIENFRIEQGKLAVAGAAKARDFYTRFPGHARAAEAKQKEYELLTIAVTQLGNTNAIPRLDALDDERLKSGTGSEEERVQMRMGKAQRAVMLKEPEGEKAMAAELERQADVIIKDFPKRDEGYELLVEVASDSEGAKANELLKRVVAEAPDGQAKQGAEGLLKKMEAVGKALPIKFEAVDGRQVDIAKMNGKVVLVDFWATWCGPCVAELPNVKKAYQDLHAKGFEIVGISLDRDKEKLNRFVADNEMAWPQYFDGLQWQNKISTQYGINSIPSMWLVDKKGVLRDINARDGLEGKIQKLLAE
jgi:thiol-disulfide isomerase/thioredoxin